MADQEAPPPRPVVICGPSGVGESISPVNKQACDFRALWTID